MSTHVALVLAEGTYIVPEERFRLASRAAMLVWARESWHVVRNGGPPANDTRADVGAVRTEPIAR